MSQPTVQEAKAFELASLVTQLKNGTIDPLLRMGVLVSLFAKLQQLAAEAHNKASDSLHGWLETIQGWYSAVIGPGTKPWANNASVGDSTQKNLVAQQVSNLLGVVNSNQGSEQTAAQAVAKTIDTAQQSISDQTSSYTQTAQIVTRKFDPSTVGLG
ncbi:MAG: hypothetical protein A3F09_01475 [Chlamydiae bacterium RIFCSPHIGHO2_12_FULL_49_11]|nr:MAG: hypothetical protein A3F09_01475 [Chlamydiae bacterium RIFCSPHIGHO2_12_FULL_49_11]